MTENRTLTLAPYLALARELTALLTPVRPRLAFRAGLEASLLEAARRQCALEKLAIAPSVAPEPSDVGWTWRQRFAGGRERRWVIGAAAVGSAVSVAGAMAYFWRQRGRRAA